MSFKLFDDKIFLQLTLLVIVLVSLTFGLVGLAIIIVYATEIPISPVEGAGSLLSAIATMFAAAVALYGINTWKRQLLYGKHLGIIWDCIAAIRNVEAKRISWYYLKTASESNPERKDLAELTTSNFEILDSALRRQQGLFGELDVIVEKNKYKWENRALELASAIHDVDKKLCELTVDAIANLPIYDELVELNRRVNLHIEQSASDLNKLEAEYH